MYGNIYNSESKSFPATRHISLTSSLSHSHGSAGLPIQGSQDRSPASPVFKPRSRLHMTLLLAGR